MIRQKARWLRLVWAALFAVATLLQLPAMTFASTVGSPQHASTPQEMTGAPHHTHQHHQHDNSHDDGAVPDGAHEGPACFALGCCFALGVASFSAPTASHILLGTLAHEPARVMLPLRPDPAVPPPRFQV